MCISFRLLRTRSTAPLALLALALSAAACDRNGLKKSLGAPPPGDPKWVEDSTLIASKPQVLYRVFKTKAGTELAPLAVIGEGGFRPMRLGNRGWRAFDLEALHNPATMVPLRSGRSFGSVTTIRGMWAERDAPLDSLPGCQVVVPTALASVPDGVQLLTSRPLPELKASRTLSSGELSEVMRQVENLVAPTKGVAMSQQSKYARTVHQVEDRAGGYPTIVVTYNDPEPAADTVNADSQRTRNLILFLDRGDYGYQTTWTYSTVGNAKSAPRLEYLDAVDTDADGKPEILLGVRIANEPFYTLVMRRSDRVWTEAVRYTGRRCQG